MVCKGAVPLFFMVSGALLLGKNESGKDLFQKRILRMILVIVIFSFLYYMKLVLKGERPFAPFSFLLSLPTDLVYLPYWFLYSYISVCLRFCRSCAHWHRICRKIPSGIWSFYRYCWTAWNRQHGYYGDTDSAVIIILADCSSMSFLSTDRIWTGSVFQWNEVSDAEEYRPESCCVCGSGSYTDDGI